MCDIIDDWLEACSERVPARMVLGIMAFFGFMVTQMIRANLYISIVGMVSDGIKNSSNQNIVVSHNQSLNNTIFTENRDVLINSKFQGFDWDEATQGILFGAFYWCYWLTELPGGIMAQKWGGRRVLGIGVTIAGVLNAFVPMASKFHVTMVAGVRAVQGLALGVTWPAMHALAGCWIPVAERSKFMTAYHGAAVGNALTYPLCGFLMESLGWESTFYMTAGVNILWAFGCWLLIYDTPAKHPRITTRERKYLRRQLLAKSRTDTGNTYKTPWLNIFKSRACWAVLAASQGVMWCSITLSMQLPTFFKNVFNFDFKLNGILSGVPELSKFGFGLCFSTLMDYLLHRNVMSLTAVRKISVATCEYIPAALLIVLSCTGASKDSTAAVVLLILISAFGGASASGSLANIVDISPNFAGVILGLIKTLSMIPGILSPLIAGILTNQNNTAYGWQLVFIITAAIHVVCCTSFLLFGSANVQPWNENTSIKEDVPLEPKLPHEEETKINIDHENQS